MIVNLISIISSHHCVIFFIPIECIYLITMYDMQGSVPVKMHVYVILHVILFFYETFSTTSGVLQGDTLAPFLFITLLDYVLREALFDNIDGFTITPCRSSRYPAVRICALVYADDIAFT